MDTPDGTIPISLEIEDNKLFESITSKNLSEGT